LGHAQVIILNVIFSVFFPILYSVYQLFFIISGVVLNDDFPRINRLPPYVFNIVNDLKAKSRARGEDIIDFGMGNPDRPAPAHIIEKLTEAAQRPDTHRYSVSRGIPRLRKAICDWYQRKFDSHNWF